MLHPERKELSGALLGNQRLPRGRLSLVLASFPWTLPSTLRVKGRVDGSCKLVSQTVLLPTNDYGYERETGGILCWNAARFKLNCGKTYSASLRAFFRFRFRAKAAFTRFFSPGFR